MGEFNFDNILGEEEIDTLFLNPDDDASEGAEGEGNNTTVTSEDDNEGEKKTNEETVAEDIDAESLFDDDESIKNPESVGNENKKDDTKEKEGTVDTKDITSPNFFSSIANALATDGVLPNLDESKVKEVTDAESFSHLIDEEINARLDDKQRRIAEALDNGVEKNTIKQYENTLNYISSITDKAIEEESEAGENLRKNLIFQDYINRGMSKEKAQKLTERAVESGTDIEDAKEALVSNKEFFENAYQDILANAKKEADEAKEARKKEAASLKKAIMEEKNIIGDLEISDDIRKKAFDSISNPVYRDPNTGEYLTAIQKYQRENSSEFCKKLGLIFALTDGFKDFDSFTKGKVKKEMKKGLKALEQTLNSSTRINSGKLNMVSGVNNENYLGEGIRLDF